MTAHELLNLIDNNSVIQLAEPDGRVIADDLTDPIYSQAFGNYVIDRIEAVEELHIIAYIKIGPIIK